MTEVILSYRPQAVSAPGVTLAELIDEREITQAELARRMGRPLNAVNEMVLGNKEITEDTALELERVLGTPAHFWLAREARYREFLARQRDAGRAVDRLDWLNKLPLKQLQESGHLPKGKLTTTFKAALVEPALRFFGVASPEGWHGQYDRVQAAFRRANPDKQTDNAAITAWLRLGELQALKANVPPFSVEKLQAGISSFRALSNLSALAISAGLQKGCADAGVVLVFVPPFPRTHVSGVARWLGDRPLIQMSLRGKWNDVFWLSFFHELAHILKHPKKAVFLDDASSSSALDSKEEKEADQFAADVLIPSAARKHLNQIELSDAAIRKFAKEIDIHPGIVVGALQYQKRVAWASPLTQLKERYQIVQH